MSGVGDFFVDLVTFGGATKAKHAAEKQSEKEDRANRAFAAQQQEILAAQQQEILKAQELEKEKTLSAAEREKRRKRASTLLTDGMGLMSQPQTAVQQLLGV